MAPMRDREDNAAAYLIRLAPILAKVLCMALACGPAGHTTLLGAYAVGI